jgi:hypothetical protein
MTIGPIKKQITKAVIDAEAARNVIYSKILKILYELINDSK